MGEAEGTLGAVRAGHQFVQVLPLTLVELVARTLPWVELAVGIGLIAGIWLRLSAAATSLLLVVFFALMVRAFAKGMQINCGCFGGTGDIISKWTLLRDGSMLAGSLLLTWMAFVRHARKPRERAFCGASWNTTKNSIRALRNRISRVPPCAPFAATWWSGSSI